MNQSRIVVVPATSRPCEDLGRRLAIIYALALKRATEKETSADCSLGEPAAEAVEKPEWDADLSPLNDSTG